MSFSLSSADYVEYTKRAAQKIGSEKDYITELDAATGDGDHWANMNMGFEKLVSESDELAKLPVPDMLKKVGMTMMSTIGGSSGALYGSAYIAAGKAVAGKEKIDREVLYTMLRAMLDAMMTRGNAKPGFKTMIDALSPAVNALKDGASLEDVKKAALDGAESTRQMEAVKGRACYQANKGVGHLDPGAVTMAYQIETLVDYILFRRGK